MHYSSAPRHLASLLVCLAACGPGQPEDTGGSSGATSTNTDDPTTAAATTSNTPTTDPPTTGGPGSSGSGDVTGDLTTAGTDEVTGDITGDPPPPAFCPPGPSVQRRLNTIQYLNTVRDLFPGLELPALELPPDPRVEGFDNIADAQSPEPSPLYAEAAAAVATAVLAAGEPLLPCPSDGGPQPKACGHDFLTQLAPRAFRRPLEPGALQQRLAEFDAALAQDGFGKALKLAVTDLLAADEFLHLQEPGGTPVDGQPGVVKLDGFAMAARLSYFLWNTMPDAELTQAAADGVLDAFEGIELQTNRLMSDPRAREAIAHLDRQWFFLHHLEPGSSADLPDPLRASMREEMTRIFQFIMFDGTSTLVDLINTPIAFPDAALADIYGIDPPAMDGELVELADSLRRTGMFTRAGWLTIGSRGDDHSPFSRGWRLLDSLFCMQLPPPPPDIDITPIEPQPDATTRELYDTILAEPACAGCHEPAHKVGYGFEHYDALGKWQDDENGKPVDASGEVVDSIGGDAAGTFDITPGLFDKLVLSRTVHDCAARKHYMYGLGRALTDADTCGLAELQQDFFGHSSMRGLISAIVQSDGFRHRLEP